MAGITLLLFSITAAYVIIVLHAEPQIAMILGCALTSAAALAHGYSWEEIEEGMIEGMTKSLGACTILLLIGLLIGIWVSAGVVPAMVCYGLELLTPKTFLVGSMLLCAAISMALGAWGTVGTVGIALISVAHILNLPMPLAAGAIVSGCYLGERVSPVSDMANLVSAVTGVDIVRNVKSVLPVNLVCLVIASVLYWIVGLKYVGTGSFGTEVAAINLLIRDQFHITLWNFTPLLLMLTCILIKVPAIPSIFAGIASGAVMAVLVQHQSLSDLASYGFYGYVSTSGNETIDALLSAGGIESLQYSLSLALAAMMLGGVMEKTGIIDGFMEPIVRRLRRTGDLSLGVIVSAFIVNVILPDSYVAVALPGQMFHGTFERNEIPLCELSRPLSSSAGAFSALIPWNACGVFVSTVLKVPVVSYMPYAFLNILVPAGAAILGYLRGAKMNRSKTDKICRLSTWDA